MPVTYRPREQARLLLEAALEQEIGVGFRPNSPSGAANLLGEEKRKDPRFAGLMVFQPANGEVFICKKEVELD